ncbi:DUF1707 SHOCT-like domain-containing protein [Actinomadura mexicana]|uniref:DUF1707 domain-containing protein n=1 Tax=Actinomadura mexicana TaxID=134959 RepID=A0A238VNB3_9ACTN|nr:DUF1707 domain-containing protein [Actinomadura mexicana]SNR34969.1 protein of unknown function [Actinomadura mexicana]
MNRRDREAMEAVLSVLCLLGVVLVGFGTFEFLAAHPALAAAWALGSTVGAVWFGCLWSGRRHADRLRAATEAHRAVRPRRRTVDDVLHQFRNGDRLGDDERTIVADALQEHFAAGRLDVAELQDRLAVALSAKTVLELAPAVKGLPMEGTGR